MNPTLKKLVLFGVGAFYLTKERVQELVKELEAEGALDPKEGQQLVKEIMQKSEQRAAELRKVVEAEVHRIAKQVAEESAKSATSTSGDNASQPKKPTRKPTSSTKKA